MNADTIDSILSLAEESDILILGEIHGTQEVPLTIASLLHDFYRLNYRAIGLEINISEQEMLRLWAADDRKLGHTATLHLPYATPATFLFPPS